MRSWTLFQLFTVLILTVGTAGWVVPAYMALALHMEGVEIAVKETGGDNPFPYLAEAQRQLKLAAVWLFAVLFVWGFLGARRLLMPTRAERTRSGGA